MFYLLDKNKNPYEVDALTMGRAFEQHFESNIVKKTFLQKYDVEISTVFLGIDHGIHWHDSPLHYKPILFETMIFWKEGEELDQWQDRYRTWKAAYYGHNHAVRLVIEEIRKKQESK
jgi:hypothetical protein